MEWAFTAVIAIAMYWFFILRPGKISFWKLAARHPNEAYHHFLNGDCWFIDEVPTNIKKEDVVGPFKLIVPELQRSISVYGLAKEIDNSQAEFIEHVS